jgi:uncharacterized protein (TIGR02647 family)
MHEDVKVPFNASTIEELNLLLQFHSATLSNGIKVHSNARPEVIAACQSLFDKELLTQHDGGYLTDAGIEALAHAQMLAGSLKLNVPGKS